MAAILLLVNHAQLTVGIIGFLRPNGPQK